MEKPKSFLFVTIDGGGNIPPMLGLARRLTERGHTVRVLTEPCLQEVVRSLGMEPVCFTRHFTRTDRKEDIFKDWNASPFSDPAMDNIVFGPTKVVVEETLRVLEAIPTDVLVADCLLPTSLIAAEALGIPGVMVFHMPEYMPGPNRPPGMLGLLPGAGRLGRWRDRMLNIIFNRMLNKYRPLVNGVRAQYQLPPVEQVADLVHRADLRFIQTSRAFDFPIEPAPANVRYTGPVLDDPDWVQPWENPWPADDARPFVVVSLSSTFQNQGAVIKRCVEALGGLDVRGLVTLGPAIDHEQFDAPENVAVVASAPHARVFPQANLVITHAGHGALMRALANGLPLICLPMGRDQGDNATKVVYHGAGVKLSPKTRAQRIRRAVVQILSDQNYRDNAAKLRKHILADAKWEIAVEELESLAQAGKKKMETAEKSGEA
jgi:MGT family glycosyltransferase